MSDHGLKQLLWIGACVLMMAPAALAQNAPVAIHLLVMDGEGAATGVRQRVTRDPAVKLEDDDHRPVPGAAVVFALPVSGPSGEFLNGSKNLTVVTDENGVAAAHGIKTNDVPGKLQIYVTASYRGLRARTLINQTLEGAPGSPAKVPELRTSRSGARWKWVVLGAAAAGGAGAGMYLANRAGGSPTSISAGTVVFGSPR